MFCGPKTIRHGESGVQNIVKAVQFSHGKTKIAQKEQKYENTEL